MPMPPFQGSITALITPFKNGALDETAFQRFVEWQVSQGSHGLVPCGTTGESPTLTHDEHKRVVELCIEAAGRRVPVIAGTGSNSTAEAVALTRHAHEAGADGALVVTPYYNKPTQEGLYLHFKAVNDSADIPIVIYNIPGRSVVDMTVETMARLAKLSNIVGVKDATANMARAESAARKHRVRFCPTLRRGCDSARLHGAWRAGLHLGHRQRCAGALLGVPARLPRRRLQARAQHSRSANAIARRVVRRIQSRPGEIRCREAWPLFERDEVAIGAAHAEFESQGR